MTTEQKMRLLDMRRTGLSVAEISNRLGISVNTVKSFIRRGQDAESSECAHCGKRLTQRPMTKPRRFCSALCRDLYWRKHRKLRDIPSIHNHQCEMCGKPFTSYGNRNRRFCSCQCYANWRKAAKI